MHRDHRNGFNFEEGIIMREKIELCTKKKKEKNEIYWFDGNSICYIGLIDLIVVRARFLKIRFKEKRKINKLISLFQELFFQTFSFLNSSTKHSVLVVQRPTWKTARRYIVSYRRLLHLNPPSPSLNKILPISHYSH